jgi:hypothetical protein
MLQAKRHTPRPMGYSCPPKTPAPYRDREMKPIPVPAATSYKDIKERVSRSGSKRDGG